MQEKYAPYLCSCSVLIRDPTSLKACFPTISSVHSIAPGFRAFGMDKAPPIARRSCFPPKSPIFTTWACRDLIRGHRGPFRSKSGFLKACSCFGRSRKGAERMLRGRADARKGAALAALAFLLVVFASVALIASPSVGGREGGGGRGRRSSSSSTPGG